MIQYSNIKITIFTYPVTTIYFPLFMFFRRFKVDTLIFAFLLPYKVTSLSSKPISLANNIIFLGSWLLAIKISLKTRQYLQYYLFMKMYKLYIFCLQFTLAPAFEVLMEVYSNPIDF